MPEYKFFLLSLGLNTSGVNFSNTSFLPIVGKKLEYVYLSSFLFVNQVHLIYWYFIII